MLGQLKLFQTFAAVFGVSSGTKLAKNLRENKSVRTYRVKGKLGEATDNCYKDGKVVERSTFLHVKQANMNKLLSSMQAAHQKKMFEYVFVEIFCRLFFF